MQNIVHNLGGYQSCQMALGNSTDTAVTTIFPKWTVIVCNTKSGYPSLKSYYGIFMLQAPYSYILHISFQNKNRIMASAGVSSGFVAGFFETGLPWAKNRILIAIANPA